MRCTSPRLHLGKPRRFNGSNPGVHQAGDVPPDIIESECGAVVPHLPDLAIGHQAQLDERLESVADAQHQAIPLFEQIHHRPADFGIAEGGGDKLPEPSGSSPPKAARDHDDLRIVNLLHQQLDGLFNGSRRRLRMITVVAIPPARSKARAVSYSQLVPGTPE